jgi:hypothetical protein
MALVICAVLLIDLIRRRNSRVLLMITNPGFPVRSQPAAPKAGVQFISAAGDVRSVPGLFELVCRFF